jgi:hypothetical protein
MKSLEYLISTFEVQKMLYDNGEIPRHDFEDLEEGEIDEVFDMNDNLIVAMYMKIDTPLWWRDDVEVVEYADNASQTSSTTTQVVAHGLTFHEPLHSGSSSTSLCNSRSAGPDFINFVPSSPPRVIARVAPPRVEHISKKPRGTGFHGVYNILSGSEYKFEVRMPRGFDGKHYIGRYTTFEEAKSVAGPLWKAYYASLDSTIFEQTSDLPELPSASTGNVALSNIKRGTKAIL